MTQILSGVTDGGHSMVTAHAESIAVLAPILSTSAVAATNSSNVVNLAMLQAADGSKYDMDRYAITIGRKSKSLDSSLPDCMVDRCGKSVSRHHARIEYVPDDTDGDYFTIESLGRHSIKVNGMASKPNTPIQLYSGSSIDIGGVTLEFVRAGDHTEYQAAFMIQSAYRNRLQRRQLHREAGQERWSKQTQDQRGIEGMASMNAAAVEARLKEAKRRAAEEMRRLREAEEEYAAIISGAPAGGTGAHLGEESKGRPDSTLRFETNNGETYEYDRDTGTTAHISAYALSRDEAATKIQSRWRGGATRLQAISVMADQWSAVDTILSGWRGYCLMRSCRIEFHEKRRSACTIQRCFRAKLADLESRHMKARGELAEGSQASDLAEENEQTFSAAADLQSVCRTHLVSLEWKPKMAEKRRAVPLVDAGSATLPKYQQIALRRAADRRKLQNQAVGPGDELEVLPLLALPPAAPLTKVRTKVQMDLELLELQGRTNERTRDQATLHQPSSSPTTPVAAAPVLAAQAAPAPGAPDTPGVSDALDALDAPAVEPAARAELAGLRVSVIRKRAVGAGATAEDLDAADDSSDAKACLIEVVVRLAAVASSISGGPGPAVSAELAAPDTSGMLPAEPAAPAAPPPAAPAAEPPGRRASKTTAPQLPKAAGVLLPRRQLPAPLEARAANTFPAGAHRQHACTVQAGAEADENGELHHDDQAMFWINLLSDSRWRAIVPHVVTIQRCARGFAVRQMNARNFQDALDSFTVDYSATCIQGLSQSSRFNSISLSPSS